MGCTIQLKKKNHFNHQEMLKIASSGLNPNQFINQQMFAYHLQYYYHPLKYIKLSNSQKTQPNSHFLSRCKLLLLCTPKTIYQKGFYNSYQEFTHPIFRQIQKDVRRTYPQHIFFKSQTNIKKFQMVLKYIAIYFPQQGYTQGLNFIVGFLLLSGATEEQTFWMFVNLALQPDYLLLGLFQQGFPLTQFYYYLFECLLSIYFPNLFKKIKKIQLSREIWVFQWFLTYFLYSFPIQGAINIWEFILLNGGCSVVYIALGIIEQIQCQLLQLDDDQAAFSCYFQRFRDKNLILEMVDFDFSKIFDFASKIRCDDYELAVMAKNCPVKSIYTTLISELQNQVETYFQYINNLKQERLKFIRKQKFQIDMQNKIAIAKKSILEKAIINEQNILKNQISFVDLVDEDEQIIYEQQNKQEMPTIGESRSFVGQSLDQIDQFDF